MFWERNIKLSKPDLNMKCNSVKQAMMISVYQ